jgi:hypothetical protein
MSYLCFRFNGLERGYQRRGGLTTKNATSDKYTGTRKRWSRVVASSELQYAVRDETGGVVKSEARLMNEATPHVDAGVSFQDQRAGNDEDNATPPSH